VSLSASDLFLSPDLTEAQAQQFLESLGFGDPAAADHHLQMMADDLVIRQTLGSVAGVLLDALLETPNPDAALVGFSRYLATRTSRTMFLEYLRDDPRALHVLANVLGTSPFLSEILIRNPEYFHWLVSQIDLSAPDSLEDDEEVEALLAVFSDPDKFLGATPFLVLFAVAIVFAFGPGLLSVDFLGERRRTATKAPETSA